MRFTATEKLLISYRIGCDVNATVSPDLMFITNKHHRYYELFQPVKPYRGEPPTLAGKDLLASVL